MVKCSFCGRDLMPGAGTMYVQVDGKILYFDRMKCEKNYVKLKRKPLTTTWVRKKDKSYKKEQ